MRYSSRRALASTLPLAALLAIVTAAHAQKPQPTGRTVPPRAAVRGFQLFAGATTAALEANRVYCGITQGGHICTRIGAFTYGLGGANWPRGTPDEYGFNSGIQLAGIVDPALATTGFPWAGDTVAALAVDLRGDIDEMQALTGVINSASAADLESWPSPAFANDTALFDASLLGREAVSDQDTWLRYWDADTSAAFGPNYWVREHTMGVLVEQRSLAWSYPEGIEDVVFFLFRITNITARTPAQYDVLKRHGYDAAAIAEIAALGAEFQRRSEARFGVEIPDAGYTIRDVYLNYTADPDVGFRVTDNYSTAVLPFATAVAYIGSFEAPAPWQYPPDIYTEPFARAPGVVGVKFLRTPRNLATGSENGVSIFTNYTGGAPFPDPGRIPQLYRYMNGTVSPALGDNSCTVTNPQQRRLCAVVQAQADTRFMQSTGPFDLRPGESALFAVAWVFAPPLARNPGRPSFDLSQFIGRDMKPGIPPGGDRLVTGLDTLRDLDATLGWVSHADLDGDGAIEEAEVTTVPGSLLGKARVAQALFDNRFLRPAAPEPPQVFVLPGDDRVTIVWRRSPTEVTGDPYYQVASDPNSPLFDPNFRRYDVEGYRIWRGTSPSRMTLLAEYDYAGTEIRDYTGRFVGDAYRDGTGAYLCAPELGITTSCPAFPHAIPLVDGGFGEPLVQVPRGGRFPMRDAAGQVTEVRLSRADTAVTGGSSGFSLRDTGVPFAYVDTTVRNGARYYYAVTAFDVNSIASAPSSLESALLPQGVTPRTQASNAGRATFITGVFGGDGTHLDPGALFPAMDPANGTLNGPIPPTNAASLTLPAEVIDLLPEGDIVAQVDSVGIGIGATFGTNPTVYVSFIAGPDTIRASFDSNVPVFNAAVTARGTMTRDILALVRLDSTRARILGIPQATGAPDRLPVHFEGLSVPMSATATGISVAAGRYGASGTTPAARYFALPYWWDGLTQPPDPTINPFPSPDHTNGRLPGVTRIWMPAAYRLPFAGSYGINAYLRSWAAAGATAWYPADLKVTWGAGGAVTVRDSTHRITLPHKRGIQPGYGFLNLSAVAAAGVTVADIADQTGSPSMNALSYHHMYAIEAVCSQYWGITCAPLQQQAQIQPLDFTNDGVADANGIAMVINGMPFFLEMATLPAAGTTWYLRSYGGGGMTATCTLPTSLAAVPTDCSDYTYTPPTTRAAWAPGVRIGIRVTQGFAITRASGALDSIHTVPDPLYIRSVAGDPSAAREIRFVRVPNQAIIRIYSLSGVLVTILTNNDPAGGGEVVWDATNRSGRPVASGVYFYHVEAPDGRIRVGRLTIVAGR
jgi:hypothetical protein